MLTITTEKSTIYINTNLLKSKLKKAIITLLKVSTTILTITGIFWIIGTAGASDNNSIPPNQIFIQILQGVFCCGVAWVLNFIKLVMEA